MFGLRQKVLLGFGGLLVIMAVIGTQSIVLLSELGQSIDIILQGDYRSVVACQKMKESLQLIESSIEFSLIESSIEFSPVERTEKARELVKFNAMQFDSALNDELKYINLPGEKEMAEQLHALYEKHKQKYPAIFDETLSNEQHKQIYLNELHPLYEEAIKTADEILQMNQENMAVAGEEVKQKADSTVKRMYIMLVAGAVLALIFVIFVRRWILLPLKTLTDSVREIEHGNLDLAVPVKSHDELAEFAHAFNAMAAHLRDVRQGDQARLIRTQRTTQLALDSLPDAVAVLSPDGNVEMVNNNAMALFALKPGDRADSPHAPWLSALWSAAREQQSVQQKGYESAIQIFEQGEEKFFLPHAVSIWDEEKRLVGITVVLADVTHLRKLDELKSGLLSTTSHELKTPLTSLQMAIHLLLEGRTGAISPRQTELLEAARSDVDRLRGIVENILDFSRIEAGRVRMDMRKIPALELIAAAAEPMRAAYKNHNVSLELENGVQLPEVWADPNRISLVFSNLLSNAMKYTPAGGMVRMAAAAEGATVRFSVSDNGKGILEPHRERIFEKFFRVPGQKTEGAGLGLAIAREITEAHGGKIQCESTAGKGSVFTFTLKRADLD